MVLIDSLRSGAAVLGIVVDALPEDVRVFHPSGLVDRSGWTAMACVELLAHGWDIAQATGVRGDAPPDEVATATVERVLPWAPRGHDGWSRLLCATGRAPLDGHARVGDDWWWHSAPLDEWDGRPRRREARWAPGGPARPVEVA